MTPASRESYNALARAFAYPTPRLLAVLVSGTSDVPDGPANERYRAFVGEVDRLAVSEWEELYTRTFDLNPLVAPYVGYQTWGDSYRRGPFLATMNRALNAAGVDPLGELPDHIAPVLRYLGAVREPLRELVEVIEPAVRRMVSTLVRSEPDNPYVELFRAVEVFLTAELKNAVRRQGEAA